LDLNGDGIADIAEGQARRASLEDLAAALAQYLPDEDESYEAVAVANPPSANGHKDGRPL